jgi:hypothetical protein
MNIKKLINSEKEYVDWVVEEFLDPSFEDRDVWKPEDRLRLEPFFKFCYGSDRNKRVMTPEEGESFDHYQKCLKDYAQAAFDKRDAMRHFHAEDLANYLMVRFDQPEEDERGECPDYDTSKVIFDSERFKPLEFPCVVIVWIDSSFDRIGDCSLLLVDFVEKSMFDSNK